MALFAHINNTCTVLTASALPPISLALSLSFSLSISLSLSLSLSLPLFLSLPFQKQVFHFLSDFIAVSAFMNLPSTSNQHLLV